MGHDEPLDQPASTGADAHGGLGADAHGGLGADVPGHSADTPAALADTGAPLLPILPPGVDAPPVPLDADDVDGQPVWHRLKPLLSVASGLSALLRGIAWAGAGGIVLGLIGLLLLGFTGGLLFIPVVLGAVACVPVFLTWQGAGAFGDLHDLPERLFDLGQLPDRAREELKSLAADAPELGRGGLLAAAKPTVKELVSLVPVVVTIRSFNPAVLAGIALSAAGSLAVAVVGVALFLLGLFT